MENVIVKIEAKEYGLEESKAKELTFGLKTVIAERELLIKEFEEVSKLELTQENLPIFKELRLKIVKNRTQGVNKWHKTNKEFFLTGGKFVDAIKNRENHVNEIMEEKLMDAEKHFENLEKEKIEKVSEQRKSELLKYDVSFVPEGLGVMPVEVWESFIHGAKIKQSEKIEAEKKAIADRIAKEKAEKEEQERIKKENAQLKKEAEEKASFEKKMFAERDKAEAERKEKERKEHKKRAEIEADRVAKERQEESLRMKEAEKLRLENETKLESERKEKERIAKELQDKKDAEIKAENERQEAIQAELNKGDADKVKDLLNDLNSLKTKYSFKSAKNKKMYSDTCTLIDKVINHINK